MAKYFIIPNNGPEIEIDGADFAKLKRRFQKSSGGPWDIDGSINTGTVIQLQNIIAIAPRMSKEENKEAAEAKAKEIVTTRKKALATHKDIPRAPKDEFSKCKLSHKVDPDSRTYADNVVVRKMASPDSDVIRYFPMCTGCGWKGQLVKSISIPKTFGMQPEEVPDYIAPEEG